MSRRSSPRTDVTLPAALVDRLSSILADMVMADLATFDVLPDTEQTAHGRPGPEGSTR
jgi:hypothetical protein